MHDMRNDDFEVIFDAVSKGAILRKGDAVHYLDGPFRTFADALEAARKRVLGGPDKSNRQSSH